MTCPKCHARSLEIISLPEIGMMASCKICGLVKYKFNTLESVGEKRKKPKMPIGKYHLPCQCHKVLKTLPCGLWFRSQKSNAKFHPDHRLQAVRVSQKAYYKKYVERYGKV